MAVLTLIAPLFFKWSDLGLQCKITVFILYLFCDDAPVLMYILLRPHGRLAIAYLCVLNVVTLTK